ncbi:MAG: serine/threonine protein kinase, partial [Myxococcales bacterium]|nr:serine/threonine protein kinase [Myxococcales bacterium]
MNPLTIPKAGDLIADKYRVERVIGQGGMGVVLAAVHDALDTRVAIKLLGAKDDDAAVRRFMREARAASKMQSAHVVRVLDVGSRDDGTPFMVMEYLEGEDLSEMVSRGHLSVAQAIRYLLHACEGLAEAHAMGLVHRDLKPSNLFLARRRDGEELVKVLDFGIALAVDGGQNQRLTATGASLGSPLYMS